MKPREFLELANEWITGVREAEWRSAVSRAYYAVFHIAREVLLACGFVVPDSDRAHGYLWLRLSNCGHTDLEEAGEELRHLRSSRNWVDYDFNRDLFHTTVLDRVERAEKVFEVLETVLTLPHLMVQVTEAGKAYERDVLQDVTWFPTP